MDRATITNEPQNWKCPVCGVQAYVPMFPVHCCCGFTQPQPQLGLGDRVAVVLSRMGLTERRYKQAKRRIGLRGDCRCKERRAALNRIGRHHSDADSHGAEHH